jgi:hypothetical protein
MNVVKLSVHKNTQWQRQQRAASDGLIQAARTVAKRKGVAGYVLIAWNGEGDASVSFDNANGIMQNATLAEFVYRKMRESQT